MTELHDFTTNRRANRLGCAVATVYHDGIYQVQIKDNAMLAIWQNQIKNCIPAQAGTRVVRPLPSIHNCIGHFLPAFVCDMLHLRGRPFYFGLLGWSFPLEPGSRPEAFFIMCWNSLLFLQYILIFLTCNPRILFGHSASRPPPPPPSSSTPDPYVPGPYPGQ